MVLPIPRVKALGWGLFEILTSAQETQLDLNISLLDQYISALGLAGIVATRSIRNWRISAKLNGDFSGNRIFMVPVRPSLGSGFHSEVPYAMPFIFGQGSDFVSTHILHSNDGLIYDDGAPTTTAFNPAAQGGFGGDPGVIGLFSADNSAIEVSSDHGHTWTGFSYLDAIAGASSFVFPADPSLYMYARIGGTVTTTIGINTAPTNVVVDVAGFNSGAEFAFDGSANILLCVQVIGDTVSKIYRTANFGTSWSLVKTLSGLGNVAWSKSRGLFVAWDDTGQIATSPTGATWTSSSTAATSAHGFNSGPSTFAIAGHAIVKSWGKLLPSGSTIAYSGVAYSFDLGATWNVYAFAAPGEIPIHIYGFNGRIYALNADYVWYCDQLEDQTLELS